MLKSWLGFGDLDLIFKVTAGLKLPNLSQNVLVCTISHELDGRFQPDLHGYNIGTWWRADLILVTLTYFSRSLRDSKRGGSVVECRTPEREVRGSRPTSAVLCPWARHFTPRKYWLITQEAMAPSRHDWKIVDWDVKPQHNQPKSSQQVLVCTISHEPAGGF